MKNIFKSLAIIAVVAIAGYNVSQSKVSNQASDMSLADVELLAYGENSSGNDTSYNPYCLHGGVGAAACSIAGGIEILGYVASVDCSVTCNSGYYACCGIRCTCKPN